MGYFPGMLRVVICSAVLLAFIALMKWGLFWSFDNLGFGWGIAVCAAISAAFIFIAWQYDRAQTRSQAGLPPTRSGHR